MMKFAPETGRGTILDINSFVMKGFRHKSVLHLTVEPCVGHGLHFFDSWLLIDPLISSNFSGGRRGIPVCVYLEIFWYSCYRGIH